MSPAVFRLSLEVCRLAPADASCADSLQLLSRCCRRSVRNSRTPGTNTLINGVYGLAARLGT